MLHGKTHHAIGPVSQDLDGEKSRFDQFPHFLNEGLIRMKQEQAVPACLQKSGAGL